MLARLREKAEEILQEAERLNGSPVAPPQRPAIPMRRPVPIDWEGRDAEPLRDARGTTGEVAETPPAAAPPAASPLGIRETLHSRAALRQAFFLREILGPPRALQGPHEDGR